MKRFKENFPHIISLLQVYISGLVLFFVFRLTLFIKEINRIEEIPASEKWSNILGAFWMGIRFDTVISGYLLSFVFLLITLGVFIKKLSAYFLKTAFWIIIITYFVAFLIYAVDIPYFGQFFSRLTIVALEWMRTPGFVFKMIFQEYTYWLFIVPFIGICVLFYYITKKIFKSIADKRITYNSWKSLSFKIFVSVIFAGFIFLGIRGRITIKSPIRVGTAYFSNYAFINKLGLSPVFTFLRSALDNADDKNKSLQLMDSKMAIQMVQKEFKIDSAIQGSPILRFRANQNGPVTKKNIVIVLMESMSCRKLSLLGNTDFHTPSLDSLANNGYYFENFFSAGIHTFNGIYSSIISYPALMKKHPMSDVEIKHYRNIATELKNFNYYNIYFSTHDGQFDNVEGFLRGNDFDRVVSQKDYPPNEVKSTLGVPDDYMFRFSIPVLTESYNKNGRFLAVFCTASDHGPYVIPEYFTPKPGSIKNQIVEYADWSIGQFIELASKEKWFDSTVFVFTADHGAPIDAVYDIALNYHHIPLIIYAPDYIKPQRFKQFGGQIDIVPTIMGILNLPYTNNTLGIDLIQESRPYMYFSSDDKIGVIDDEYFLVIKDDHSTGLYKYRLNDRNDYSQSDAGRVNIMSNYAFSNLQTAQWMINNDK